MLTKIKRELQALRRKTQDLFSGNKFCKKNKGAYPWADSIEITQPFTKSETLDAKKHNLRLASERIGRYVIKPGETFSFWRCVCNPNTGKFECSRGIRGGVLQIERGGGLCQASGIIYHLSLVAGLKVIERYNHSKDLYTDETRFCPLGSDATVAYGYRDLRVKNTSEHVVRFELQVHDDHFTGILHSSGAIKRREIHFEYVLKPENVIEATTIDKSDGQILAVSRYEKI